MDKPLLLVLLHGDYTARDFIDSGVLARLQDRFELNFVVTNVLKTDLSQFGKTLGVYRFPDYGKQRMRLWEIGFSLRHLAGLDPIVRTQSNRLESFMRGRSDRMKKLVFFLFSLGLATPLSALLQRVLAWTAPEFFEFPRRAVAALLPCGINDPFWDDMVTLCRRRGVPSLTLTTNWDNIAHKIFFQQPDRIGVWGEQAYLFARLLQRLPADKILTVGTPRFEPYRQVRLSKSDARARLGLPPSGPVLLFAGAGVSFDEVSLLEAIEQACADGRLPADLRVIYKPHPKRHKRAAEPPLRPETYKRVQLLIHEGFTPLEEYPVLLTAVDGMITPMSTMMLEATLMGLPTLGLAYDDKAHGDYSWNNARLNNHLHPILSGPWHAPCSARADFLPALDRLLALAGNEEISQKARAAAGFIIHDDGRSYAERLIQTLEDIAGLERVPVRVETPA